MSIYRHTVIYGLYTIHWLHTNTEEQHTMVDKHVMYHSISFLHVYGTCLAHIFMRQVFIALCFVAVLEYVGLQLPA